MTTLAAAPAGSRSYDFRILYWALPCVVLAWFFAELLLVVVRSRSMFTRRFARRHRVTGAAYLAWLTAGVVDLLVQPSASLWGHYTVVYDAILGILGTALALTAAFDFKRAHAHVKNPASGALEQGATVTFSEMLEHSFYQGLNLAQALYLHALSCVPATMAAHLPLLVLVTLPWCWRHWFPINKFSDNYTKHDPGTLIALMYRMKKYQYLLYKHCLLHGLNISVAVMTLSVGNAHGVQLTCGNGVASQPHFRLFWLCLNTAYVVLVGVPLRPPLDNQPPPCCAQVCYGVLFADHGEEALHAAVHDAAAEPAAHGSLHRVCRVRHLAPRVPAIGRPVVCPQLLPPWPRACQHPVGSCCGLADDATASVGLRTLHYGGEYGGELSSQHGKLNVLHSHHNDDSQTLISQSWTQRWGQPRPQPTGRRCGSLGHECGYTQ